MRYFVVSDIHSHYSQLMSSLRAHGYNKNNRDHVLVIDGDIFDRGKEPLELFKFIKSIPIKRRILIKGNHEDIYKALLNEEFPSNADYQNGTVETFCRIAGEDPSILDPFKLLVNNESLTREELSKLIHINWKKVQEKVRNSEVTKFINSNEWVDYFEIGRFIIVHGCIPLNRKDYLNYCYKSDWRKEADPLAWEDARWSQAYEMQQKGLLNEETNKDKVFVVGHVGSYIHHELFESKKIKPNFNIFFGHNLIAIDGSTVMSNQVNVLVIENDDVVVED